MGFLIFRSSCFLPLSDFFEAATREKWKKKRPTFGRQLTNSIKCNSFWETLTKIDICQNFGGTIVNSLRKKFGAVQRCADLRKNMQIKRIFACTCWLRYSREQARDSHCYVLSYPYVEVQKIWSYCIHVSILFRGNAVFRDCLCRYWIPKVDIQMDT